MSSRARRREAARTNLVLPALQAPVLRLCLRMRRDLAVGNGISSAACSQACFVVIIIVDALDTNHTATLAIGLAIAVGRVHIGQARSVTLERCEVVAIVPGRKWRSRGPSDLLAVLLHRRALLKQKHAARVLNWVEAF